LWIGLPESHRKDALESALMSLVALAIGRAQEEAITELRHVAWLLPFAP
jgi:hypothetical protein